MSYHDWRLQCRESPRKIYSQTRVLELHGPFYPILLSYFSSKVRGNNKCLFQKKTNEYITENKKIEKAKSKWINKKKYTACKTKKLKKHSKSLTTSLKFSIHFIIKLLDTDAALECHSLTFFNHGLVQPRQYLWYYARSILW